VYRKLQKRPFILKLEINYNLKIPQYYKMNFRKKNLNKAGLNNTTLFDNFLYYPINGTGGALFFL
jgi:hypothetical protein